MSGYQHTRITRAKRFVLYQIVYALPFKGSGIFKPGSTGLLSICFKTFHPISRYIYKEFGHP